MGGGAEVFTADQTTKLVAFWVCCWVLGNYIFWPLWNHRHFWSLICRPTALDLYRRRLCRSQVYCFVAVVGGFDLFSQCRWHPDDLLHAFTKEHQVLFSMAIGHWLVAVWEDQRSPEFLAAGIRTGDSHGVDDPDELLGRAYLWHHSFACICFASVLALQSCTGLGVFGLLFELPVLLMNHREFALYADSRPKWFLEYARVDQFWGWLEMIFLAARGGASLTYVYSLAFWWDAVAAMSGVEVFLYHVMAIFFTALNYTLLMSFLSYWAQDDRARAWKTNEAAFEEAALTEAPAEVADSPGDVDVDGADWRKALTSQREPLPPEGDMGDRSLVKLPEDWLLEQTAEQDGHVRIEVDGIGYNVTSFLELHPGGAAVLRKYAGKDASAAFHRARHSMNAKRMMQKYAVGPIMKTPRSYRIYEHDEDQERLHQEGARIFSTVGFVGLALPRSAYAGLVEAAGSASFGVMLMPGLLLALIAGLWHFVLLCMTTTTLSDGFTLSSCLYAACLLLHVVAFSLAREPLPASTPASPTGIEIAAVMCFAIEEVVQYLFHRGSRTWTGRVFLGFGLVLASWAMRGMEAASLFSTSHGLAGIWLAVTTAALCHRAGDGRPKEQVVPEVMVGGALLAPYSALLLYYLTTADPACSRAFEAWAPASFSGFLASLAVGLSMVAAVGSLINDAYVCTDAWAVRCFALVMSFAAGVAGGLSSWRWLAWMAWFVHVSTLGGRLAEQHTVCIANDTFKDLHPYQLGTRATWDLFRTFTGTTVWFFMMKPIKFIVNIIMPEEYHVFALLMPVFDFGDDATLGVAAYYAPTAATSATKGPEHFECSMSHFDMEHPDGPSDVYKRLNTIRDAWSEFQRPAKGLLANVACFFPSAGDADLYKQAHISCWQTSEDAQAWRAKSGSCREETRERQGGVLRTCGSLSAMLRPHGRIRHQDRCKECARLVESEQLGEHAPRSCSVCGGDTFGHPYF